MENPISRKYFQYSLCANPVDLCTRWQVFCLGPTSRSGVKPLHPSVADSHPCPMRFIRTQTPHVLPLAMAKPSKSGTTFRKGTPKPSKHTCLMSPSPCQLRYMPMPSHNPQLGGSSNVVRIHIALVGRNEWFRLTW